MELSSIMEPLDILQHFQRQIPGCFGAVVGPPEGPVAQLRATERFPAASLIKIPILLFFLKEVERKTAELKEIVTLRDKDKVGGSGVLLELHEGIPLTLLDLATLMIVVSDNTATNLLMDRFGIGKIQSWIEEIGMKQTLLARKLMVALDAPPANFTSPLDMHTMFRKLQSGELLSDSSSTLAVDILCRQQYNEKIPRLLPKELRVAHKTGEISGVRHDCGMVIAGGRRLLLSFLTRDVTDELETDRLFGELARDLYRHYFEQR